MNHAAKELADCADVGALELTLRSLCSEFGALSRLEIITMTEAGKRHAVCLLQLESMRRDRELMARLGADRFGEDLCVVVDLREPASA
jgi:hypothetical protein